MLKSGFKILSLSLSKVVARSLSQHPSTPLSPQLLLPRQRLPAGTVGLPIANRASSTSTLRTPWSFPLNVFRAEFPVPELPRPLFRNSLPNPSCQKTAETFVGRLFGSRCIGNGAGAKKAWSAHWNMGKPPNSRQLAEAETQPHTNRRVRTTRIGRAMRTPRGERTSYQIHEDA